VLASDDEGNGEKVVEEVNPDFSDGDVAGLIYKIEGTDQQRIVTILDKDTGLAVKSYVTTPALLSLITSNQVCVGRYVTAHGVRTNEALLMVEGFDVDRTTQCHSPAAK
jgi:hypothetical protein